MFIPNLDCTIERQLSTDLYGAVALSPVRPERCSVVKLRSDSQHTTVRADSSGTRGFADEEVRDATVLLSPSTKAQLGDCLTVLGVKIKITSKHPRVTAFGRLDHYEVRGELWAS